MRMSERDQGYQRNWQHGCERNVTGCPGLAGTKSGASDHHQDSAGHRYHRKHQPGQGIAKQTAVGALPPNVKAGNQEHQQKQRACAKTDRVRRQIRPVAKGASEKEENIFDSRDRMRKKPPDWWMIGRLFVIPEIKQQF